MTETDNERKQRFDALFAAHRSDVVSYCGWRASSASDAQDAAAEVFLIAWRRLDGVPEVHALRRANPRTKVGFADAVEAAADPVRARILAEDVPEPAGTSRASTRVVPRRRLAAGALLVAGAAAAAVLAVGSPGDEGGVENAAAAVKRAATATAASADRSGTAVVRITHDGEFWAGTTIRWNDGDIAASRARPERDGRAGDQFRVVDGTFYGIDPVDGGWVDQGSTANIDPDSGTTPDEALAAVLEDVEGVTLRRLGDSMTGLTTTRLGDGSIVYAGTVPAGQIARESGFKEGERIRVFPFGYVAHDEAADPTAALDTAITVGEDGLIRELAVTWGTWTYTVRYSDLGTTAAIVAPKNAKSLLKLRKVAENQQR
jgi:hypothetical protein